MPSTGKRTNRAKGALLDSISVVAAELAASLEVGASASHRLTQGTLRERRFRRLIRPLVPARFRLVSGLIVNSKGASSRQQDCLVVDALHAAPFVDESDEGIVPVETVAAAIELKTRATPAEVRSAVRATASGKALIRKHWRKERRPFPTGGTIDFDVETKMFTSILCFTGPKDTGKVEQAFFEENLKIEKEDRCNALIVLDRLFLTWGSKDTRIHFWPPLSDRGSVFRSESRAYLFLLYYFMLSTHLSQYEFPLLDLIAYATGKLDTSHTFEERAI